MLNFFGGDMVVLQEKVYIGYLGKGCRFIKTTVKWVLMTLLSSILLFLVNRGWKFRTHSYSLVSRLFKACYFPNNDYLESRLGSNPNYVWKSIFSAKMVVNKGAR